MWFNVNATQRTIVDRGVDFSPGTGVTVPTIERCWGVPCGIGSTTIFGGWKHLSTILGGRGDPSVSLTLDAGPEQLIGALALIRAATGGVGSFAEAIGNPFSIVRRAQEALGFEGVGFCELGSAFRRRRSRGRWGDS